MNWKNINNQKLIDAILSLKSEDEAKRFLRDLMTVGEIEEFSKRLKAAEMLTDNIAYSLIVQETGLSSTTVARVSKWLNKGEGGYKTIIARLHHNNPLKPRKGLL